MRSSSRKNAEPSAWFCSKCTTNNAPDDDFCTNRACQLSRKNVGVDILPGGDVGTRPAENVQVKFLEKFVRCGECDGCKADECGVCGMCLDMPKRGGKGVKRQPCERRVCTVIHQAAEERRKEREVQLEKLREKREAERLQRLARQEEERLQKYEEREAAKEAKAAERAQKAAAKAVAAALGKRTTSSSSGGARVPRAPTYPPTLPAYGWGVQSLSFPVGMAVEVLGVDGAVRGACFPARIVEPTAAELQKRPRGEALPRRPAPLLEQSKLSDEVPHLTELGASLVGLNWPDMAPIDEQPCPCTGPGCPANKRARVTSKAADHMASPSSSSSSSSMHDKGGVSLRKSAGALWTLVEYDGLYVEEDTERPPTETQQQPSPPPRLLREWVSTDLVRDRPPGCPPGFLYVVRPGDRLQCLLDGIWWDVTMEAADQKEAEHGGAPYVVAPLLVAATHRAHASELRPMWMVDGDGSAIAWRYEVLAGTAKCQGGTGAAAGLAPEAGAAPPEYLLGAKPTFVFGDLVPRRHGGGAAAGEAPRVDWFTPRKNNKRKALVERFPILEGILTANDGDPVGTKA